MVKKLSECTMLEELFEMWKEEQKNESDVDWQITKGETKNIKKETFCKDGVINPDRFQKQRIKVLFITNESNADDYIENGQANRVDDFIEYSESGYDSWRGKMRERICSLYMVITNQYDVEPQSVAQDFAFMNLNKRGGTNQIKDGKHIDKYCSLYGSFIKREIELINPDIIIWLGVNTFDMNIHIKYLGAVREADKVFMEFNDKRVPVIRMWHTSSRSNYRKLDKFNNKVTAKLAAKLVDELERYHIQSK